MLELTLRRHLILLILPVFALLAACSQLPAAVPDSGADLSDPDVGGGVGVETGPQTPIPTATPTGEASPRLDAAARATADSRPPTPEPTAAPAIQPPTAEPAPEDEPPPEPPAPTEAAPPEPSPTPSGEIIHVVQPGENLYRIGLRYGLSWQAIAEYNGITNPDAITVGQELRIPENRDEE